jgi:hypothetical protein
MRKSPESEKVTVRAAVTAWRRKLDRNRLDRMMTSCLRRILSPKEAVPSGVSRRIKAGSCGMA